MIDLLIRDCQVVDGSGSPPVQTAVAVDAGRIVGLGETCSARRTVEADGRIVTPGFIDMHTHSDLALIDSPVLDMKLAQGVTLEVLGQDGLSCAPVTPERRELVAELISALDGETANEWEWTTVAQYLDRLDLRTSQNTAYLLPHGTIRAVVMGAEQRAAADSEIEEMRALVLEGMQDGALGLSTGLSYPPANASTTEEVVRLTETIQPFGGVYVTHLRDYGDRLLDATGEALEIGRQADVPVHFSHLQAPGKRNHGLAQRLLEDMDAARSFGQDVTYDVYPYESASTMLTAFLPPPLRFLPRREAEALLADTTTRRDLAAQINDGPPFGMDVGWSDLWIANGLTELGVQEARLVDIAEERNETVGESVVALLGATSCRASVIAASTRESDVTLCLLAPLATIGSDGILVGERPHPRGFGTFPRFLRRAGENGIPLGEAIAAMTGRSARRLGLRDRGIVQVGAAADLCLFDLSSFHDTATFDHPKQLAVGMDMVFVNGVVVWEDGYATGATPGRALRRVST